MKDITPKDFEIIPFKDKIVVMDPESDPSGGVGSRVGGFGGTPTEAVSKAINNAGNLVTDLINARLDTEAKTILDSFTFGVSGAIQIGEYVNGVTGDIKISPNGIVARNSSGANTIAVNGTTGDVTIIGTITASAGSIGGWTIASTYLYYDGATDALSAGMASLDYPFYAGKKYADRATAPFRVTPAGVLYATSGNFTGNITGSTITGGTLSTSGAGVQRVRIVTDAGSTPTQSANSLAVINSSNNIIGFLGSGSNGILEITPTNTSQTGIYVANATALQLTNPLVQLSVAKTDSTGKTLVLTNVGTGDTLSVTNSGSGKGLTVDVNSSTGIGGYFTSTNASNSNNVVEIYKEGGGAGHALYSSITGIESNVAGSFKQATAKAAPVGESHFYRVLKLTGNTNDMYIWVSDGTDPNGVLSGTAGSICLNCDVNGKLMYCSGGTVWV